MTGIDDLVTRTARGLATARAADVARRLLEGHNRLVVDDEFAGITVGRTVYEVPHWRDKPITRLKIERLRWRARRA